jgi:hypothetical protein
MSNLRARKLASKSGGFPVWDVRQAKLAQLAKPAKQAEAWSIEEGTLDPISQLLSTGYWILATDLSYISTKVCHSRGESP